MASPRIPDLAILLLVQVSISFFLSSFFPSFLLPSFLRSSILLACLLPSFLRFHFNLFFPRFFAIPTTHAPYLILLMICFNIVNGGWGPYGPYGSCSKTCGGGYQKRYRKCNKPKPQYGGRPCSGSNSQTGMCNTIYCASMLLISVIGRYG